MIIKTVELTETGNYTVNKDADMISVPNDMGNRHRVMVQEWIDAGNTPSPFVGPSALEVWQQEMAESDTLIPRWAEDLYDGLELEIRDGISAVTKNKIIQKKAKRESRPS
jgi:hypothetical protein